MNQSELEKHLAKIENLKYKGTRYNDNVKSLMEFKESNRRNVSWFLIFIAQDFEALIDLLIKDNQAKLVENTNQLLKLLGTNNEKPL